MPNVLLILALLALGTACGGGSNAAANGGYESQPEATTEVAAGDEASGGEVAIKESGADLETGTEVDDDSAVQESAQEAVQEAIQEPIQEAIQELPPEASGEEAPQETAAETDTPCVVLQSGTWVGSGDAFPMKMNVTLTMNAGACSFTLKWSMNHGANADGGTLQGDTVTLFSNGTDYYYSCVGTADGPGHVSGVCADDGASFDLSAK